MDTPNCTLSTRLLLVPGKTISLPAGSIFVDPETGSWVSLNRKAISFINNLDGNSSVAHLVANYDFASVKACLIMLWSVGLLEIQGRRINRKRDYKRNKTPYYAMLNITRDCNMKCVYCYKPSQDNWGESMSIETAKIAISKMLDLPSTLPLTVAFHGGEPLLEFKNIREIVAITENIAKRKNRQVRFQLQTNGTLLTNEIAELLKRKKVCVGISLDGHREEYNLCRVYKNGQGAINDILKGLEILQRHKIPHSVISVINQYNVNHLDSIFRFLVNKGITGLNFIPGQRINYGEGFSEGVSATPHQLYEGTVKLIEEMIKFNRESKISASVFNITSIVSNLICQGTCSMCARSPCGAGTEMLVFDINGDVYPCDNFSGVREFNCGNVIYDDISTIQKSSAMKNFKTKVVDSIPECSACEWKRICCAGSIWSTCSPYEDSWHSTQYCSFYKRIIPYIINLFLTGVDSRLLLPSRK